MKVYLIRYDDVPCIYELVWRKPLGIVLRIHADVANAIEPVSNNLSIISSHKLEFPHLGEFKNVIGENFGFGGTLRFLGIKNDFLEYQIPAKRCRKLIGICDQCKGTGKDRYSYNGRCLRCSGVGQEFAYDYSEAIAVCTSFGILLRLIQYPDVVTSSTDLQLLDLSLYSSKNGFSIGGTYGKKIVDYLASRGPGSIPEMAEAMMVTSKSMDGKILQFDKKYFRANITSIDGWLNIDCPGQACGLNPSSMCLYKGEGYDFAPHNVDQPMQQLILTSSLAALHNLVRSST